MAHFGELLDAARRTEVCIANLPGFIPPLQVRTQKKTDLIVSSTAHLLQDRSFEAISIQDIARLSNCSVTSIYARFVDKEALLPAVNLIIMEHYRLVITGSFAGMHTKDVESICRKYVDLNSEFYRDNFNFIRAAATIESDFIFQQMNACFASLSDILLSSFQDVSEQVPSNTLAVVKFGVQQVHTNFRDRIMCGNLQSFDTSSLIRLFITIINSDIV